MNKKAVICIVGPTASGKTGLSIQLAKRINGEIISADSMQIYKGLDIATAKVTKVEMQEVPHHLIDICDIDESFSVADFKDMCYDKIDEIISRNNIPIIVGGTGLYLSAVVNNMDFPKQELDTEYREYLYELAKVKSNEYIYNMLKEVDPKSAEEIHPNNLKRVIRALEIAKIEGMLKSEHMQNEKNRIVEQDIPYNFYIFYLDFDRETLYGRINKRVDIMLESGILSEAKKVYDRKLPSNCTCMQAIGYKEFFPYFEGKISLEEAVEKLKLETRKYSKRQETYFKNKFDLIVLDGKLAREKQIQIILKDIQ